MQIQLCSIMGLSHVYLAGCGLEPLHAMVDCVAGMGGFLAAAA